MGIYSIKPAFVRSLQGVSGKLIGMRVSADALTVFAVFLSLCGGIQLALSERFRWALLIVPVLALSRITLNALDGMVALASGTASAFGEVKNEVADRVSDICWFSGLTLVVEPAWALGALVIVLLNSYIGTVTKAAGGPRLYLGAMGKADRMVWLSLAAVLQFTGFREHDFLTTFVLVVVVGGSITAIQRLLAAKRALVTQDAP